MNKFENLAYKIGYFGALIIMILGFIALIIGGIGLINWLIRLVF